MNRTGNFAQVSLLAQIQGDHDRFLQKLAKMLHSWERHFQIPIDHTAFHYDVNSRYTAYVWWYAEPGLIFQLTHWGNGSLFVNLAVDTQRHHPRKFATFLKIVQKLVERFSLRIIASNPPVDKIQNWTREEILQLWEELKWAGRVYDELL